MLSVTHNDGRSEPLINIQGAEIEEEVNGAFTLSFASFFVDNPGYELLEEESIVDLAGHEFVVKQLEEENGWKQIVAVHDYFSLIDSWQDATYGGTRTMEDLAPFILFGTGWTWEVEPGIPAGFVPNFGDDNRLALIQTACTALECEVDIVPNRHLRFAKEIGQDRDSQLRIGHNIETLKRSIDTTRLVTVGRGQGANDLKVEWRSPNIALYGERYGEVIVDERFTSADNLREKVRQNTQDTPETTIELTMSEIRKAGYHNSIDLGDWVWVIDERKKLLIHVRVTKIKSFPLSGESPIITLSNVMQTEQDLLAEVDIKIDETKREYRSKFEQTNEKFFFEVQRLNGEFVESYAQMNILSDEINQRVRTITHEQDLQEVLSTANSYADAKAIEGQGYTDSALQTVTERLTIAESSIVQQAAMIESKVNVTTFETGLLNANAYADSVAVQALGDAQVYAETKANEARLSAEAVAAAEASLAETNANAYADGIVTDEEQARINDAAAKLTEAKQYAEQKAAEAENAANAYADGATAPIVTRITNAESSITQLSNDITSRVREDVYLVDKQNLQGDIDSLEGTTGNLSSRLYSAESSISQQAGEISSKVSYTDYNGNQVMSMLNQTATTFKMQAEKIDLTGIVRVADSIEMGTTGNGATKAIKFNGTDAWIYSQGAFNLTIDTSDLYLLGTTHVSGLDLSGASYVNWGSHAPDTVARFG